MQVRRRRVLDTIRAIVDDHTSMAIRSCPQWVALLSGALVGYAALCGSTAGATQSRSVPLVRVRDVALPGKLTRFDYQSVDQTNRTLYVAHLGDSTLDIVDLDTLHLVGSVPRIADVHGVAVASDFGRVYASATGTNELVTIDATTKRVLHRTPTGAFPDGVAYDPDERLVFVSNKNAGSVTVVDATTGGVAGTVELADETGNVVYDPRARLIYAAARAPDMLVAIDPVDLQVTNRIRLSGCDGAHGVYLDSQNRRAFIACERNARLVTVDLETGLQLSKSSVGQDPDVLAYDVALRRLYVASESGTVAVFETSGRTPKKIGQSHLAAAAHTVAVDQATHRVYFPLQDIGGRPVLRVMKPTSI
jgi:DNA-binding beta-propeller fold protein YncE